MIRRLPLLIILLTSLPLVFPFFHSGFLAVGDGTAHLFRQINYDQALRDGQIPPRWAVNAAHGLGAPIFLYNWFLPYLLIEFLILPGMALIPAVRIFNIFCLLAAPLGMYFWAKKYTSAWPAVVAAILFAWAPYRLMSTYLYGAWGEMLAFVIVPFLGLSLLSLSRKPTTKNFLSATLLTAALVTAHNLSALIYLPLLFLLVFLPQPTIKVARRIALAYLTAAGLTAFFWLPAIARNNLIQYDFLSLYRANINEYGHFPTLLDDLTHLWYQFSSPQAKVWYKDFTLGLPLTVAAAISLFVLISKKFAHKNVLLLTTFLGLLCYFLTLRESIPLWEMTPLKVITYSYRLFAPASVFLSLSAALALAPFWPKASRFLKVSFLTLITLAALVAGHLYLTPATGYLNTDSEYFSHGEQSLHPFDTGFISGTMEFLPKTASADFVAGLDKTTIGPLPKIVPQESHQITISNVVSHVGSLSFNYQATSPQTVLINTLNFPNWHLYIDNQPLATTPDQAGRILLNLPSSSSKTTVLLRWQNDSLENIANVISLLTLLIIIISLTSLKKLTRVKSFRPL